jgi:hypothetical protein
VKCLHIILTCYIRPDEWSFDLQCLSGHNVSADAAVPILVDALIKLRRGQRAQLLLMSGMHNAWQFVSLAAIIGTISFARYLEITTSNMQPDSYEEQSRRIRLLLHRAVGEARTMKLVFAPLTLLFDTEGFDMFGCGRCCDDNACISECRGTSQRKLGTTIGCQSKTIGAMCTIANR